MAHWDWLPLEKIKHWVRPVVSKPSSCPSCEVAAPTDETAKKPTSLYVNSVAVFCKNTKISQCLSHRVKLVTCLCASWMVDKDFSHRWPVLAFPDILVFLSHCWLLHYLSCSRDSKANIQLTQLSRGPSLMSLLLSRTRTDLVFPAWQVQVQIGFFKQTLQLTFALVKSQFSRYLRTPILLLNTFPREGGADESYFGGREGIDIFWAFSCCSVWITSLFSFFSKVFPVLMASFFLILIKLQFFFSDIINSFLSKLSLQVSFLN